jgi:hypothetical protein
MVHCAVMWRAQGTAKRGQQVLLGCCGGQHLGCQINAALKIAVPVLLCLRSGPDFFCMT